MAVTLETLIGHAPAMLTVFCIVGPMAQASYNTPEGEGVTLSVPGVINFDHTGGGENIYVRGATGAGSPAGCVASRRADVGRDHRLPGCVRDYP